MKMDVIGRPVTVRVANLGTADDASAIDAYVRAQPDATPFHLTAWSRAIEAGCRQRAHYLVAEAADGAICGVLPLTEVRSLLFGAAMVSAGFAVDGGPIADDATISQALVDAGWALAQANRCPTMELRGGAAPADGWQVDDSTYLGFVRDIPADEEACLLAIPRKQRAEVRKGLANALQVTTGRHHGIARDHYQIYAESVRNLGTPVFPAGLFSAVLREFGDAADILLVADAGRPEASVLSLYMNGTVYPYWGGGTARARALRANDVMYFALMRHAAERGCTRFDFGRSKAGTGAAAFKKNWGFEGTARCYFKRSADGQPVRDINPMSPRYRMMVAAWQRLPLWAANGIGPWLARGLG